MLPPTFTLWQRRPLVQGIEARGRHAGRHIEERISGTSVAQFAARIFVHYRECDRGMGMTGYGSTPYKRRHASARIIAIHALDLRHHAASARHHQKDATQRAAKLPPAVSRAIVLPLLSKASIVRPDVAISRASRRASVVLRCPGKEPGHDDGNLKSGLLDRG